MKLWGWFTDQDYVYLLARLRGAALKRSVDLARWITEAAFPLIATTMGGDRGKKPVDTPADMLLPSRKRWLGDGGSDRAHGGCLFYDRYVWFFFLFPQSPAAR